MELNLKLESLPFKKVNNIDNSRVINNIYTGDLLSWVMGHMKGENGALLTVLNTTNLIAVAVLRDISCIVFCENVMPSLEVIEKANEENISLFVSTKPTFDSALIIYELGTK